MKNIINWTLGGFFRSLGRILCYLAIGGIIAFLIAVNSDKINPKILGYKLLGIDVVNAATITPSYARYMTLWCRGNNCPYTESGSTTSSGWVERNTSYTQPGTIGAYQKLTHIKFRTQVSSSNYLGSGNQYLVQQTFNLNPRCVNGELNQWNYVLNLTYSDNTTFDDESFQASCQLKNNDNYGVTCTYTIQPVKNVKEWTFRILFPYDNLIGICNNGSETSTPYAFDSVNYKTITITGNTDTTDAINNQTIIIENAINTTNEYIQQTNDILKDTDVSEDSSDMADFINDFDLDSPFNISELVLLPINFIEDVFLEDSTSDLCTTWRSKNICFPNGKIIWSRSDIAPFKTFFTIVVGGMLGWLMVRMLVKTYEEALNPKMADAGVRVMKL